MGAPIRKVGPFAALATLADASAQELGDALTAFDAPQIHETLSAFGVVVSSTVPGILGRAWTARIQIRRLSGVG